MTVTEVASMVGIRRIDELGTIFGRDTCGGTRLPMGGERLLAEGIGGG
jgi:hypothetical protein